MTRIGFVIAAVCFMLPLALSTACDKKSDAAGGASSAQAAPSGSAPDGRRDRDHEHDSDAGREHDHPR